MKKLYLFLAILGAIIPYAFFFSFFSTEGLNFPLFLWQIFERKPAAGFSADFLIATLVFWVFIFQRARQSKGPKPLIYFLLSCIVGLACALPAYLYANEDWQQ